MKLVQELKNHKRKKPIRVMRKINYRITVNITQKTMKLGFRAKMPEEMEGKRIRVQAVFTQRQVERRFTVRHAIR